MFPILNEGWVLRGWAGPSDEFSTCLYHPSTDRLYTLDADSFSLFSAIDNGLECGAIEGWDAHLADAVEDLQAIGALGLSRFPAHVKQYQRYRFAKTPLLRNVCWLITGKCNLSCHHCYMGAPEHRWDELPGDEIAHIMSELVSANALAVVLTGGEPLLRTDLIGIIEKLWQSGIRIRGINTNGILIDESFVKKLIATGARPDISISFDGHNYHSDMRSLDKSQALKIIETAATLVNAGFRVSINTCVTTRNAEELEGTFDILARAGVSAWRINTPSKMGEWAATCVKEGATIDQEIVAYKRLLDKWLASGRPFQLSLGNVFRSGKCSGDDPDNEQADRYTEETPVCDYYKDEVAILPDGTVVPCNAFMNIPALDNFGNVLKEGLGPIWASEAMRKIKELSVGELLQRETNASCRKCNLLAQCGLGCRIGAFTEGGDVLGRDPRMCQTMRAHYSYFRPFDRCQ